MLSINWKAGEVAELSGIVRMCGSLAAHQNHLGVFESKDAWAPAQTHWESVSYPSDSDAY